MARESQKDHGSSPVDRIAVLDDNGQATFADGVGQRHHAPCSVARRACCFRCCCCSSYRVTKEWLEKVEPCLKAARIPSAFRPSCNQYPRTTAVAVVVTRSHLIHT